MVSMVNESFNCKQRRVGKNNINLATHSAPIKPSLELLETRCLALHIRIRAQAPTESHNVHNTEEATRDVGSTVEKSDRNRGDWESHDQKFFISRLRKLLHV